ncbi:hypothetical protein [Halomarina litorea]|uniref:hypothetical protein n=1 Tax=Halomarina litorea TaxID=2961595 RepID=UPI0020C2517A|nr:hypothetical protein [Halomarina sp. BCD28]
MVVSSVGVFAQDVWSYPDISDLLFSLGYVVGWFAFVAMAHLHFRSTRRFGQGVYLFFASVGIALFLFGFGGQHFSVLYPGAVWLFGLWFVSVVLTILVCYFELGDVPGPFRIEDPRDKL